MKTFSRLYARLCSAIGPKDFGTDRGWAGRGVLSEFDGIHGLEILVSDQTPEANESNYKTAWETDADEVLFRRDKKIMLYWREKK